MPQTHLELWAKCQQFIKDNIGEDQFNCWFRDITSLRFENKHLHVFVPSDVYVQHIEEKYLRVLSAGIKKVYGENVMLHYAYNVKADDPDSMVDMASSRPSTEVVRQTLGAMQRQTQANPGVFDPQLNPRYTLENYCRSDSNKIAYSIAEAIAQDPRMRAFNPFFVFGATGVGKTHLIQGIGCRIKETRPESRVLYVTARQFESQYTTAVRQSNTNQFFNFYQSMEVLIVDDIQELQNKPSTQNTFFNIFNYLHLNNKLIIFSSDRAPAEMEGFEARLLGRFRSGSTVELQRPDLDLRRSVLRQKAEMNGIDLGDDVMEYIVENVTESVRDLEGVMSSMLAYSTNLNRPVNLQLAKEVVSHQVRVRRSQIDFGTIAEKVSSFYGIPTDTLYGKSRKREISDARQIAMYLAKKYTTMPLTAIGRTISRSHATVIYSVRNVEERLAVERQLQSEVQEIETTIFA